uniref:Uncharacterized protein n=1 Tax=Panagrolaimus superbus TaxID=310955 RepID=A0A914YCV4_9BILA
MDECCGFDIYDCTQPSTQPSTEDFFRLSSRLYKSADQLSLDDRMNLLPVLEDLVSKFEDCFMLKNLVRSIRRFIDEEILPYKGLYYKELPYKACLESDDGDEEQEYMDDFEFVDDDDDGHGATHDELFVPLRKGSPLRFDGLSVVSECDSETFDDGATSYTDEHESMQESTFVNDLKQDKVEVLGRIPELAFKKLSFDDVCNKKSVKRSVRNAVRRVSSAVRNAFS